MSAGVSRAGRDYAAKHCDMILAAIESPAKTAEKVAAIKEMTRERYGRELKAFGVGHARVPIPTSRLRRSTGG